MSPLMIPREEYFEPEYKRARPATPAPAVQPPQPPSTPERERLRRERALRDSAMHNMVLAWHKLVRADKDDAATAVERVGKEIFGEERFGEAMAEMVIHPPDSEDEGEGADGDLGGEGEGEANGVGGEGAMENGGAGESEAEGEQA